MRRLAALAAVACLLLACGDSTKAQDAGVAMDLSAQIGDGAVPISDATMIADDAADAAGSPKTPGDLWIFAGPYVAWLNPPTDLPAWWDKRSDAWMAFTAAGQSQWPNVMRRAAVIATAENSIQQACLETATSASPKTCAQLGTPNDQSLNQYFSYIKSHGLKFALEKGLLIDTQLIAGDSAINATCGSEAYGTEADLRNLLQKITDAGGTVDYLRMDEPLTFGVNACHDTPKNVATVVASTIANIVRGYFPNVQVGDVEAVGSAPDAASTLVAWADDFATATGKPLAFFHSDTQWSDGVDFVTDTFVSLASALKTRSIPFGVIYDAGPTPTTDTAWTADAISNFTRTEATPGLVVDQPVFQSWAANPSMTLPESTAGTLTNIAFQYVLPKTALTIETQSGNAVDVTLTGATSASDALSPIANANVSVQATDIDNKWGLTTRTFAGVVPSNAVYGVIGIRQGVEGSTMSQPSGEVDLGAITVHYMNGASVASTWTSVYTTPMVLTVSPSTTFSTNLSSPASVSCNGAKAIAMAPSSSFQLSVPMSATGSAENSGYVTIIFLDSSCTGVLRTFNWFTPSSQLLTTSSSLTDTSGVLPVQVPALIESSSAELRATYNGDNATHRPSTVAKNL